MRGVFTSTASGRVSAINRGARRVFQSIVIEVDDSIDSVVNAIAREELVSPFEAVKARLLESGEWTALRVRPSIKWRILQPHQRAFS